MRVAAGFASLATLAAAVPALAAPTLGAAYSDHMVLQRGQPIVIAGTAQPGKTVAATLGTAKATAKVNAQGHFHLEFPARQADDTGLTLTVTDPSGSASWTDILVGDVWLCSGQSNMEFPVERSIMGAQRIAGAADPKLRILAIPKATATQPQDTFGTPVEWRASAPDVVPSFSAPCFYMAQKLRADLDIPIGVVGSYWGGSQIRAWLTPQSGERFYGAEQMALLRQYGTDPQGATVAFAPGWEDWWRAHNGGSEPWNDPEAVAWQDVPKIAPWTDWQGTSLAADPARNVMLRRRVELSAAQAKAGGTLSIGIIDDGDMTFVNGKPVGNTFSWDTERHYAVPASYLHEGSNEVLVVAANGWGSGGFQSAPERLNFAVDGGATIPLADGWQYAVAQERGSPPRAPWDTIAGIGGMHNRMIAPLGPMRFAGAAWYQGESDAGIPGYADRLTALLAGWRAQFGEQMRMLVVQLPDFGERRAGPGASGWAEIREAERAVVAADGNAALASAIDLGAWNELHPPNKLEVGERLAMGAEGEAMPMPVSATRGSGEIVVNSNGLRDGLVVFSGADPLGVELCGEEQESCRYAPARIEGDRLIIAEDGRPATRVRYAWADAPIVNLFDGRGLPVPGFELEIAQ
ncbi:Ig-like domain-containing protein [Erythrobacter sp. LQ02-29]|uniref:Ig-like domain-containing protein n=1 Tax=Erythrobacter sp. LQ02-29 TaxID=2920384 RepID=UPI001F4EDE0B|nr:Ig-like domain-containing protein [Erythrobacter sp. LQ02-29]